VADRTPSFETDPEIRPGDPQAEGHDVVGDEFIETDRDEMPAERRKRSLRKPLLLAAPIVVLLGALFFYLHGGRYESNDDAFLQSGLV
jgi:membrane fusion protein (multidrug efflux system)